MTLPPMVSKVARLCLRAISWWEKDIPQPTPLMAARSSSRKLLSWGMEPQHFVSGDVILKIFCDVAALPTSCTCWTDRCWCFCASQHWLLKKQASELPGAVPASSDQSITTGVRHPLQSDHRSCLHSGVSRALSFAAFVQLHACNDFGKHKGGWRGRGKRGLSFAMRCPHSHTCALSLFGQLQSIRNCIHGIGLHAFESNAWDSDWTIDVLSLACHPVPWNPYNIKALPTFRTWVFLQPPQHSSSS